MMQLKGQAQRLIRTRLYHKHGMDEAPEGMQHPPRLRRNADQLLICEELV
jgi:hypothetical protein